MPLTPEGKKAMDRLRKALENAEETAEQSLQERRRVILWPRDDQDWIDFNAWDDSDAYY